jgi:hypothetical protein
MATTYGEYWSIPGLIASSTVSSGQYKPVKLSSTAGTVTACTANTDIAIGVLMNDPGTGEPADVAFAGLVVCYPEAATTAGSYVCASTTGRCVTTTDANDDAFGIAIDAPGAAGDLIRVILSHFNY